MYIHVYVYVCGPMCIYMNMYIDMSVNLYRRMYTHICVQALVECRPIAVHCAPAAFCEGFLCPTLRGWMFIMRSSYLHSLGCSYRLYRYHGTNLCSFCLHRLANPGHGRKGLASKITCSPSPSNDCQKTHDSLPR